MRLSLTLRWASTNSTSYITKFSPFNPQLPRHPSQTSLDKTRLSSGAMSQPNLSMTSALIEVRLSSSSPVSHSNTLPRIAMMILCWCSRSKARVLYQCRKSRHQELETWHFSTGTHLKKMPQSVSCSNLAPTIGLSLCRKRSSTVSRSMIKVPNLTNPYLSAEVSKLCLRTEILLFNRNFTSLVFRAFWKSKPFKPKIFKK